MECRSKLEECKNKLYHEALAVMEQESDKALRFFTALEDYRDSRKKVGEVKFIIAEKKRVDDENKVAAIGCLIGFVGVAVALIWLMSIFS